MEKESIEEKSQKSKKLKKRWIFLMVVAVIALAVGIAAIVDGVNGIEALGSFVTDQILGMKWLNALVGLALAALFGEKFLSVRAFAESISVQYGTVEEDSLLIKLRCGLTMEIRDYKNNAEEKAKALCSAFENMADYLKLGGTMYCVSTDSGALRVVLPDGRVVA